ncbi:MAG: glycosyltransferase family 39 protein [Lachnospiraceae bacterium]|nr:glycosyltransferase family 39 protein [Lachnospiraceae bacterium]
MAAFLLLAAVYISLVWNNNVWMDEAFTASLVHTGFKGVIARSMADTLPPLYNIILWIATTVFGYSIPVMKITSAIPMILTLLLGATTVRKRFGFRTSLIFMMCITFMPLMLYYGVEIRMYSLGFFFATASGIFAYEVICSPSRKNWIFFTCFSVLAGYSHHFAFVTVAFVYFWLLVYFVFSDRTGIRSWLWCLLGTFVAYLPCLIVTIAQISRVSGYFSMPDVDLPLFVQYALYPYTVGFTPASVLCVLLPAAAFAVVIKKIFIDKEKPADMLFALCCFSVYYGVLIFGTVISKLMSANIFVDRYLFFSTGLLWLCVSVILGSSDRIFAAAAVTVLIIGVCSYILMYRTEYAENADDEILFLRDNIGEGDIFFDIGGHEEMQNCIPFYTFVDSKTPDLSYVYPLERAIEASKESKTGLWISVMDGYELSEEDEETLKDNGLELQKMADFEFDRYRCGFYKAVER